ncbi:hypothetical protein QBC37DRAFT_127415 [Rhypophila decipiens]|uniref:Uncharacterized protein n=1 Tax=Rhypophila decipiens TaxID=261697 RepID=A0AAN6YC81_9PEZI|nr:hypothetical protein QBC37DRAFT_127415 [Rhypophila decipiens]
MSPELMLDLLSPWPAAFATTMVVMVGKHACGLSLNGTNWLRCALLSMVAGTLHHREKRSADAYALIVRTKFPIRHVHGSIHRIERILSSWPSDMNAIPHLQNTGLYQSDIQSFFLGTVPSPRLIQTGIILQRIPASPEARLSMLYPVQLLRVETLAPEQICWTQVFAWYSFH